MIPFSYRTTALTCGSVFGALCLILLLVPGTIFWLFDVEATASALVLAKRAAILFLGLGALMLLTAGHVSNPTRSAIQTAVTLMLVSIAVLGLIEWARGAVGSGIWLAIGAETVLAGMMISAR